VDDVHVLTQLPLNQIHGLSQECYNQRVDVFITLEARREIEALGIVRPRRSTWGVLIGHRRGFRFVVEKVFPAGDGRSVPKEGLLAGLDGIWPGRTIGLFAVSPDASFKKAVLGPAWYGKLILRWSGPAKAPVVRPSVVEFGRKFFLAPVPLVPAAKEKAHE